MRRWKGSEDVPGFRITPPPPPALDRQEALGRELRRLLPRLTAQVTAEAAPGHPRRPGRPERHEEHQ